ncbi:MAG TPA: histidine phosphatase family protein [Candidatus Levilactobacillus faecigallinarum]|uniref:Histidine phosphatase family protein n=1 Tax=Candidatus Levilactobacillus faecigallinarum TaxID=2838638 RepID=A0A9D1U452_9LACO|nr:histidine phosphatase family protein [Candidatus Levilactobacillus faecigallinarum]
MKTVDVYIVRHGETYFNVFHEFQGWGDTPLTDRGHQQLAATATALRNHTFQRIYTSDTTRAVDSAAQIQTTNRWHLPVTSLKTLREHFYGSFEGQSVAHTWELIARAHGCQTYADLVAQYSVDATQDMLQAVDPSGLAETSADFWARFEQGLMQIYDQSAGDQPVLLISHSSNIRALIARYAPNLLDPLTPENSKITRIQLTATPTLAVTVAYYNQTTATH